MYLNFRSLCKSKSDQLEILTSQSEPLVFDRNLKQLKQTIPSTEIS